MKFIIIGLFLGLSSLANAGAYTGKSEIAWISNILNKKFVISGNWVNALNCSKMEQGIWYIESMNDSMEELQSMYSTALAAYMSGKTIELYSHKCGSDGRPYARSLYLPSRSGS